MKYGLITFKNTRNIGDDIQSYAAIQYLPNIDCYIEREELDTYVPEHNEQISVIMNGRFLHNPRNWPPSPYINPLFVSTHFTNYLNDEVPIYLKDTGIDYLKKYSPIGLRDKLVKNVFDDNKIDNYFSGCLTLNINKFKNIEKTDQICLVDVSDEITSKVFKNQTYNIKSVTHSLELSENIKLSWEQRFNNVEELLKTYQESKLVITTRLHCALPCLALGTNVVLIYNEDNLDVKNRIEEYTPYLNTMSELEFLNADFGKIKKIQNSNKYLELAIKNDELCKKFVSKSLVKKHDIISPNIYKSLYVNNKIKYENIITKIDKLNIDKLNDLTIYNNYLLKMNKEIYDVNVEYANDINFLRPENEKLRLINESLISEKDYLTKNILKLVENQNILIKDSNMLKEIEVYNEKLKMEKEVLLIEKEYLIQNISNQNFQLTELVSIRNQLDSILYSRSYRITKKMINLIKKATGLFRRKR